MKKLFSLLVLSLLTLAIVPSSLAQDDAEATEEPIERAEADIVIWAVTEYVDTLQELGDTFGADFDVTVAVQGASFEDLDKVLPVAGPAGQGPDIFMSPHDKLGNYIASGLVAPLEIANADLFSEPALRAFNYNGDIYGIPFVTENVGFLRNIDIVPDAPQTWAEVLEISRELAADNGDDFADNSYGFVRMEGDPYHFFPIQTAFGGYVFGLNEDGSYNPSDIGLSNEGSLEAAAYWQTFVEEGLQPVGVDWELMHSMFESGQSAMTITGPWALDRFRESGVNYAISDIPDGGQPFLGVQGLLVSAFSEQQLLAGIFLNEYVATDEGMQALFEANNRQPAWLTTIDAIEDEDLASFANAGLNGLSMPAIPEMAQVWDAWGNAVILVAQGAEESEAAFTNAAEQVQTLIDEAAEN